MNFKEYFNLNEGLIKVDTDNINQYVINHIDEIISKINETLKSGYETYVEDDLINNNINIPIIIQRDINPKDSFLSTQNDTIYLSSENLKSLIKNKPKFIDFLQKALIHEVTHLNDVGSKFKPTYTGDDHSEYVNSSKEFQPFVNMHLETVKQMLLKDPTNKEKIINALRFGNTFPNKDIDSFIKKLNPKNKIKFVKYILQNL